MQYNLYIMLIYYILYIFSVYFLTYVLHTLTFAPMASLLYNNSIMTSIMYYNTVGIIFMQFTTFIYDTK